MAKNLRILSIPHVTNVGEQFIVTVRLSKKFETEYVDFLYCKLNDWFENKKVRLEKQDRKDPKYDYFSLKIEFNEMYTHYCHFRIKIKDGEKIVKRDPIKNEPYISEDGEGHHWVIYVNKVIGQIRKAKIITPIIFTSEENMIYCECLGNQKTISKEKPDEDITKIIFPNKENYIFRVHYKDINPDQQEWIQDILYNELERFLIEGIVVIGI